MALAAALVLVALFWRAGLLLLDPAGCGLPLPHDHIFLGSAGPGQLSAHLAAERACKMERDGDSHQAHTAQARPGAVLSVNESDIGQAGLLLALTLALLLPQMCAPRVPQGLAQFRAASRALGLSLTFPPPTPPPLWRLTCRVPS